MGHARSRHYVGGLLDLLQEVQVTLRRSGYSANPFSADEMVFEDRDLFGFVWVAPTVDGLTKGWEVRHDNFISRRAGSLRKAADKAWNLYAIFLTQDKPTELERAALSRIEEDFRASRKIASGDLNTPEHVIRALYPLSPIRNVVSLEAEATSERFSARLSNIPRKALDLLLREQDLTSIIQEFIEAHENR